MMECQIFSIDQPFIIDGCLFLIFHNIWIMPLTIEKYESQWEGLSHILWKKNVPNHQPVHSGIPKVELTWENVIDHIVDIKWIFMAQANEEHADMIGI